MNESDDEVIESADQTIERAKEAIDDANRLIQAAKQSRITMDVMKRQLSGEVERDSVKADDQKEETEDDND